MGTAHLLWERAGHEGKDVAHRQSLSGEQYFMAKYYDFLAYRPGRSSKPFRTAACIVHGTPQECAINRMQFDN